VSLSRADMETELKNRARVLGAFAGTDSLNRLRYALRKGAFQAWTHRDWDFKNSTTTISTTAGNRGPYDAPSGLVRFAAARRLAVFGYLDKDILVPIYGTDTADFRPYIRVQNGKIYFVDDPGTATLTLNYLGEFSNSIEENTLGTTLALFPNGLNDAVLTLAMADLWKDLPGMAEQARMKEMEGLGLVDAFWEEYTLDKYQKTISPKGLNRAGIDFIARVVTVLGMSSEAGINQV
jgi:hypothetical protein